MAKHDALERLLADILADVGTGRISRVSTLEDGRGALLDGCVEHTGWIRINEAAVLAPVLIHELIHRVRPQYTELAVKQWSTRLWRYMKRPTIQQLYKQYRDRIRE